MPRGSECPTCGRDIGVWAVVVAALPNRFYCPRCGEKVWYRAAGGLIAVFSLLLVPLFALAGCAAWAVGFDRPALAGGAALAALLGGGVVFELGYVLALRHGGYQLESARAANDEWDDEEF